MTYPFITFLERRIRWLLERMHSFAMVEKDTRDWLRWQSPEMILIAGTSLSLFISNHLCCRQMFACLNWISSSNACMVRILRIYSNLCGNYSFYVVACTKHGIPQGCCCNYFFSSCLHGNAQLSLSGYCV